MKLHLPFLQLLIFLLTFSANLNAADITRNGFVLDDALIPVDEILSGGPPRDGIPAIDQPKFLEADEAAFLNDEDRILGVFLEGQARAYPVRILDWHEIVNDSIGDSSFVVTYCPLCGTGMVFSTRGFDEAPDFGVSGLLYQSDVLFYDRQTESLWSQIMAKAVTGKHRGRELEKLPVFHTSWKSWLSEHPETQVLSTDTGFSRNYNRSPYAGYQDSSGIMFAVSHKAPKEFHPKEFVLGIESEGEYKAYPFSELAKIEQTSFSDTVGGMEFTIHWNQEARSAHVTDSSGAAVASLTSVWFAWYTFHPETDIFRAEAS